MRGINGENCRSITIGLIVLVVMVMLTSDVFAEISREIGIDESAYEETGEIEEQGEKGEEGDKRFVVAPLVLSNPSFGSGIGLMGMYFYSPSPSDTISPPSFVSMAGAYSDTDSYFVGVYNYTFLREDSWRLSFGAGGGRINNELDVPKIPTAEFSTDIVAVYARSDWRVKGNWFLGVKGTYADVSYKAKNEAGRAYFKIFDVDDTTKGSFGPIVSYDSRDHPRYPHQGILAEFSVTANPEWLGSDKEYHVLEASVNRYQKVREGQVLALRAYGRFTSSDTPYIGLSTLGRRSDLRGYTSGENVAENLLSTQAEYRWMLTKKFGVVGFGGVAALYDGGIDNIDSDSVFFSGGVGIRYVLHEENRVNFRVDFAVGEEDEDGLYVSISEAF
jgi:outer membrane protein assembly factor BamA